MHFLSFVWDPSPGIDLGFFVIRYYSLMFVVAFTLGWFITKRIFNRENLGQEKLDSLFIYMVIAILIGARMGHVIFYQPELITRDFLSVFLPFSFVPEFEYTGFQGLASHGAAIAVIVAMFIYSKKILQKPMLWILDRVVIPVASGAIFVRIGNFINSEIIGEPTGSDFGVVFAQLGEDFARHPAQLYESAGYVFVFLILLYIYWKTDKRNYLGFLFGSFLILLWTVRFLVEFVKESQGGFESVLGKTLLTGQWLSIPFIILGIYMVVASSKKKYVNEEA